MNPNGLLLREGYIFAIQDVRGRYLSEGTFEDVRPETDRHTGKKDVDESTDTFDTIEYLTKKGPKNNGRVGQLGISCPGFYTTVGLLSRHPALKAASPQAPVTDWFWDDDHHNGAYFLTGVMSFWASFGQPRPQPLAHYPDGPQLATPDGYAFYQQLGPLKNVNEQYFHGQYKHWNDIVAHPNYDAFWQTRARDPCPHLHDGAKHLVPARGPQPPDLRAQHLRGRRHRLQSPNSPPLPQPRPRLAAGGAGAAVSECRVSFSLP